MAAGRGSVKPQCCFAQNAVDPDFCASFIGHAGNRARFPMDRCSRMTARYDYHDSINILRVVGLGWYPGMAMLDRVSRILVWKCRKTWQRRRKMSILGVGKQDTAATLKVDIKDKVSKQSATDFLKGLDLASITQDQGRNTKIMDAIAAGAKK
jgi:hypothetical protein